MMVELEKTYLVKTLPVGLTDCEKKEIIDVYYPKNSEYPSLRLRKNGNNFEITKKQPVLDGDASEQNEHTIALTKKEFDALSILIGKRVRKFRYYFDYNGRRAEFDIFQDLLDGLVLVDFEFKTIEEKDKFEMPEFCLADVTQEKFIAGGMICGKSYDDIIGDLDRFDYKKLYI